MNRTCYLFEMNYPFRDGLQALRRLRARSLDDLLAAVAPRERFNVQRLHERVRREGFESPQEAHARIEINFRCEWRLPTPEAAPSLRSRWIELTVPLWLKERSRFLSAFAPTQSVAAAAARLLILSLSDNNARIQPLRLGHQEFMALEDWIRSEDHIASGSISRAIFEDAPFKGEVFSQVSLRRDSLETTDAYNQLKRKARIWRALTFLSPRWSGLQHGLVCRLERTGKLTVYTPTVTETAYASLLTQLERVFVAVHTVEQAFKEIEEAH